MPKVKAGQMSLPEIRNLARQHNKASQIKGIDTISRSALMGEIEKMGYEIDHERKRIIKRTMNKIQQKKQTKSIAPEGERKPQKRTKKKALIAGGEKPPMVKTQTTKKKPPPIKPALEKQKKKKEAIAQKRSSLTGTGY